MTSRRAAGLLFVLPVMVSVSTGSAWAEDPSSTVVKSSTPSTAVTTGSVAPGTPAKPQGLTEPQEQLRPSIGDDQPTGAAPPADEIAPSAMDEGAGWEAAVEAAPGPTPLIGEQQAKAVQRINAYFNGITNLQGNFDQVNSTNKHTTGRFYVQRPGKFRFDYAPPSALRIVADGAFLAIEDSDLKTVEKYPSSRRRSACCSTDAVDLGRDARIVGVESEEGIARHLARGQRGRGRRTHQALLSTPGRSCTEAMGDHGRPRTYRRK